MNRFLSVAGKLVGGLFLCGGGTVSIGLLLAMALWHPTGWALAALWVPTVIFGLAPSAVGGFLLYGSVRAQRHALRERFFQLLQANRGRISLIDFATATQLEPAIARRHLDDWAKVCHASFEVTEGGDVYYVFSADSIALPGDRRGQEFRRVVREFVRSW